MLRLLVIHDHEEQVFAVPETVAKLGSAPENDIVVPVLGVSRRHALLRRTRGGVEVVDLRSKNGLLIHGERAPRAILTPGLKLQIGTAWLEVEEISSSEEALALMVSHSPGRSRPFLSTVTAELRGDRESRSPADSVLTLTNHITRVSVGLPGKRTDLLVRIRATLGAEAFASFERTENERLRICESVGKFVSEDTKLLASITADARTAVPQEVVLKRAGHLLLAGRDVWFLGARFTEEPLARETWRKDFLRFLADQFFAPVRALDDLEASEAARVLTLARGNKKRAAELLDISRGTLYKLLARSRVVRRQPQ